MLNKIKQWYNLQMGGLQMGGLHKNNSLSIRTIPAFLFQN